MMAGVGSWLLSITGASVLCALADGLMPAGPVRLVGRLVCGLVLLAVILAPLAQLDLEGGQRWLEEYHLGLEDRTQELERQVDEQMKTIIEQEYAAYIVDKAAELGLTCTARVSCRAGEEGLFLPERAEVSGFLTEGERERLSLVIQEDLGIPEEEQAYVEEGELP